MKNFSRSKLFELFLTILSFCLCLLFFTPVTDDYASFSSSCAAGQFSDYPYCTYYWGYLGISIVYKFLYQYIPAYDWLSISFLVYEFCGLYLILRTIRTVIFREGQYALLIRSIQVFFVLFFLENIIYLSHTRSSLIFCGIALINLLFTDKIERKGIFINSLIFLFGMLIRPESSMGMFLLVSIGYLIWRFDLFHLIRRSFIPIIAMATMLTAYSIDWSHTDQFLKKVEPEVEYKLMEKRIIDISDMKTPIDSIKYQAATSGLCFDPKILTPDFFRSVLRPGADLSKTHAIARLLHVLSFYRYYLFVPLYSFALILFCICHPFYRKQLFRIALFQILTFLIIYSVDFTGGLISGRHFLSLSLLSLLIISFYFFHETIHSPWSGHMLLNITSVGLVLFGVCISIYEYSRDVTDLVNQIKCYEVAMNSMDNLYSGRTIILTTDNFHLFDHVFSLKNKKYSRNKYLMYDVWTYWLSKDYQEYLKRQCACDPLNPVAFFRWLSNSKALYIAEPWRYDLTSKYMDLVHGEKVNFQPNYFYKSPSCINDQDLERFDLRQVVISQ